MLRINLFAQVKFANLNGVFVRLFNEIMNDISMECPKISIYIIEIYEISSQAQ